MMTILGILAGAAVLVVLALYMMGNLPTFIDSLMTWFKGRLGM